MSDEQLWLPVPSWTRYKILLVVSRTLSGSRSASLSLLKTYFYSRGLRTGSASEWSLQWAALYRFRNTIKYEPRSDGLPSRHFSLYSEGLFSRSFNGIVKQKLFHFWQRTCPLGCRYRIHCWMQNAPDTKCLRSHSSIMTSSKWRSWEKTNF